MILWEIWLPKYGKIYNALERKNYFDIQKENRHEKKKEINIVLNKYVYFEKAIRKIQIS